MEMNAPTPRAPSGFARLRLAPVSAMILGAGLLSACATPAPPAAAPQVSVAQPPPAPPPRAPQLVDAGPELTGTASWYKPGPGLRRTCTGEVFRKDGMTAASPSIPVGTRVRVSLADDGQDDRSIIVRVNDCMPAGHRILDLSEGAAAQLGLVNLGVAEVNVTPVMLVDNR